MEGSWIIELEKFSRPIENDSDRWLQFFKIGEQLDDRNLPKWMSTPEMVQAMNTLRQFSEKEINYHIYQARQNYLRQQRAIQWEIAHAMQEKAQAMQEKAQAMQEKAQAMKEKAAVEQAMMEKDKEIERLKALLSAT